MIKTNQIEEIFKGFYRVILDFPDKSILFKVLDKSYKYVWVVEHIENGIEWDNYNHTLYGVKLFQNIKVRNLKLEFLMETEQFLNYIPEINQSVKLLQTNIVPPYYLELSKFHGKSKYDLLKAKVDFLFELDLPGATDYSPIISPNLGYLENLLLKIKE